MEMISEVNREIFERTGGLLVNRVAARCRGGGGTGHKRGSRRPSGAWPPGVHLPRPGAGPTRANVPLLGTARGLFLAKKHYKRIPVGVGRDVGWV